MLERDAICFDVIVQPQSSDKAATITRSQNANESINSRFLINEIGVYELAYN